MLKITQSSSLLTVLTEPEIILNLTRNTTQEEKLEEGGKRVFIFTDSLGFNPATNVQHPGSVRSVDPAGTHGAGLQGPDALLM